MKPEPLELFHGTDAYFKQFSMDFAGRKGMASNGHLGVWLAMDRELAHPCGVSVVGISELKEWHEAAGRLEREAPDPDKGREAAANFYRRLRADFMAEGSDFLRIQEKDGATLTCVALDPAILLVTAGLSQALPGAMA